MADKKRKKRPVTSHLNLAARSSRTTLSRRLAALDLYPGQDAVLLAIDDANTIALRDLAEQLSVKPPTITKTIARLENQGLVERQSVKEAGRQSRALLTPQGAAMVDGVRAAQDAIERQAMSGFSGRERKTLRKLLSRVRKNLRDTRQEADSGDAVADD